MAIRKKFIGAAQVDGSKIKLLNNQSLVGLDSLGADVSILKVDTSGKVQLQSLPQVSSDPSASNDLARKSWIDSQLSGKQASLGTGTANQFLRGDLSWAIPSKGARVLTVGIDANTIAGCIALCSSPSLSNNYIIEIPAGSYTENLTIPGNVHLKGMANPNDSLTVKITGQHTITGASANALNNRVAIANIQFSNAHATNATLSISGSADTEVQVTGCFFDHTATASTAKTFSLGAFGKLYINNSRVRMPGAGQGGTHFVIAAGGSLYSMAGLDADGGTCSIDMTGQGYAQLVNAILSCQGSQVIKIAASGQVLTTQTAITNNAAIGSGVNMVGALANMFATHSVFNIQDNAASFVVTGVANSYFGFFANSYSHIPGVVTRNTKIGSNVVQLRYSNSLSTTDLSDFQANVRAAAVADAIVDGVTNVAPSQNAVFDALALKLDSSLKGAVNGLAELDGSGKLPSSQLPAIAVTDTFVVASQAAMLALTAEVGDIAIRTDASKTFVLAAAPASTLANWKELLSPGAVVSVNGQTGSVSLDSDDVAEGTSNLYFTDARAAAAAANQQKHSRIVLSATDISNGYVEVATNIIGVPLVMNGPSRMPLLPTDDFTVSGKRITWNVATVGPGGEEALVEGEIIHVFYMG